MNIIIAAVVGGIVLLWGGILGLLKLVDLFERKHMLFLGAYSTLVAGCVMGLVLYTNYQRQQESRKELQAQMDQFSARLNGLSEKLMSQLDEKAQLTASEFQIRVELQNEKKNHERTRQELEQRIEEYNALKASLDTVLASQRRYREEAERQRQLRHQAEEARYAGLRESLDTYYRSLQTAQKQLTTLERDVVQLQTQTAGMHKAQTALLAKIDQYHAKLSASLKSLDKKVADLAAAQSGIRGQLAPLASRVDSLYIWKQKK